MKMPLPHAPWILLLSLGAVVLVPGSAGAELKMKVRPDGTRVIYNEPTVSTSYGGGSAVQRRVPPRELLPVIHRHSRETGLDPYLIHSVIQAESDFDTAAVSRKGALGLMQLMPATAAGLGVSNPFDVDQNVRGGARYLRQMLDRFGRLDLALAAYNAGPGAVERHGGVPPYAETQRYVHKVLSLYRGTPRDGGSTARQELAELRAAARKREQPQRQGKSPRLVRGPHQRLVMTTD
jgi:soluble lytic murein transglycosylase